MLSRPEMGELKYMPPEQELAGAINSKVREVHQAGFWLQSRDGRSERAARSQATDRFTCDVSTLPIWSD